MMRMALSNQKIASDEAHDVRGPLRSARDPFELLHALIGAFMATPPMRQRPLGQGSAEAARIPDRLFIP